MNEEWRPVLTHPDFYEMSTFGRVKSVARKVWIVDPRGRNFWRPIKERILTPARRKYPSGKIYLHVSLWREHVLRVERVHILVLEAFIGGRPDGYYGCHRDDDSTNNRLDNLYWGTPTENCQDKILHGRQQRGEQIPWSKLTESDVVNIRSLKGVVSQDELAALYGVGQSQISRIQNGHQWLHVQRES